MDLMQRSQTFVSAIQDGDWGTVDAYLADDFLFIGSLPEPISKQVWLGIQQIYKVAFPDINYNFEVQGGESNQVRASTQLTGTHTGDLDLTILGMGVIPATNKAFSQPRQGSVATWDGDKVVSIEVDDIPNTGLLSILAQLGVQPPSG